MLLKNIIMTFSDFKLLVRFIALQKASIRPNYCLFVFLVYMDSFIFNLRTVSLDSLKIKPQWTYAPTFVPYLIIDILSVFLTNL